MGRPNAIDTGGGVDEFLAHYGVKGMKWGVRKDNANTPSYDRETRISRVPAARDTATGDTYPINPRGQRISDDAARTAVLKVAAKSGTEVLSNKQLQDLVTRMNLEQQYNRLNPQTKSVGREFAELALRAGAPMLVSALSPQLGPAAPIATAIATAIAKKK